MSGGGRPSGRQLAVHPERAVGMPAVRRLVARLSGARICFGKPVEAAGRTVIPVATLRTAGGTGFGESGGDEASGGGGAGGVLEARPVGFIEIGPEGTRYEAIKDPGAGLRRLGAGLGLVIAGRTLGRALRGGGPAALRAALARRGALAARRGRVPRRHLRR